MTSFYDRAVAVFGCAAGGRVAWPYGMANPECRPDPAGFEQRCAEQRAKQEIMVAWAEGYGLKASDSACCPRWLTKNASRRCRWDSEGECTHYATGEDQHWLDHTIGWLKNRKPAAITSAPYSIDDEDRARLDWWTSADPRLRVAEGPGWYNFHTQQIVLWRTDRIAQVAPAQGLAEWGAQPVPGRGGTQHGDRRCDGLAERRVLLIQDGPPRSSR